MTKAIGRGIIAVAAGKDGGGCFQHLPKGGVAMDYIGAIFAIALIALLIKLIDSINKK